MRVSVIGLGYVGSVTSACLADSGHSVVGMDTSKEKVEMINKAQAPFVEPGLQEIIVEAIRAGSLLATTDLHEALREADVILICVGTPQGPEGHPDLSSVQRVARQVAEFYHDRFGEATIAIRSTIPPGTTRKLQHYFEEQTPHARFHLAFNPEFLREGNAVEDFRDPPFVIVGSTSEEAHKTVSLLYSDIRRQPILIEPEEAEMIKYVCNCYHACKIIFANEIGRLLGSLSINARKVMDVVCQDTKLNISSKYLKPGFSYGGSCLPKDVAALISMASNHSANLPMIQAIPKSNALHTNTAVSQITQMNPQKIALLGLSFKQSTDDLRNSPAIEVARALIDNGFNISVFDPNIDLKRLIGQNLDYVRNRLPEIDSIIETSPSAVLNDADLAVMTYYEPSFIEHLRMLRRPIEILDLSNTISEDYLGSHNVVRLF
ncbi:MAG: nucleotide sugar dehydrogenase [Candidatus Lokiarchaeota archaeon]|nr:nucleotide sugar dehydrogenase [Candidatus Lokiarchaeota archaeon]